MDFLGYAFLWVNVPLFAHNLSYITEFVNIFRCYFIIFSQISPIYHIMDR